MSKRDEMLTRMNSFSEHNNLLNMAVSRFKWNGLPPGLDGRMLERYILAGMAVGFNHPTAGPVILPGFWADSLDLYGYPRAYTAFGYNYQSPSFNIAADEASIFYNDDSMKPFTPTIQRYQNLLTSIWSTIRLNVRQQRIPWMYGGSKEEIQSIRTAINAQEVNPEVLFVSNGLFDAMSSGQKVFPTPTQYIAPELLMTYRQVMNQYLTLIGVDNVPIEKRERQVTGEVEGNRAIVLANRRAAIECRQKAAERFNELTGLSVSVDWGFEDGPTVFPVPEHE